ncbi:hypothetical protein [Neisseria arctica]|nr:hypothetical protein [Neisseria arctica]UOO86878.1 hypothetical protein LVJ86_01090 [Neisseria arctica]
MWMISVVWFMVVSWVRAREMRANRMAKPVFVAVLFYGCSLLVGVISKNS